MLNIIKKYFSITRSAHPFKLIMERFYFITIRTFFKFPNAAINSSLFITFFNIIMYFRMIGSRYYLKVTNRIIEFITINMMNSFLRKGKQLASKMFFHNIPMFHHVSSRFIGVFMFFKKNNFITLFSYKFPTFPHRVFLSSFCNRHFFLCFFANYEIYFSSHVVQYILNVNKSKGNYEY